MKKNKPYDSASQYHSSQTNRGRKFVYSAIILLPELHTCLMLKKRNYMYILALVGGACQSVKHNGSGKYISGVFLSTYLLWNDR